MGNALLADISKWQPAAIDWHAYVAWSRQGDGVARVILRSSYGVGYTDAHFEEYWAGAVAAGVEVIGVYHYCFPEFNAPAAEADWQRKVVGKRLRKDDFYMLDFEENTPAATSSWAYGWLSHQEQQTGRMPRFYSYKALIVEKLQDARLAAFPLILAEWTYDPSSRPPAPHPWSHYEILQYSDKASIPGIGSRVDANVYVGIHLPAPQPLPPVPAPTPTVSPPTPTGGSMTIPNGWHDDGTTLTAPNKVAVVGPFRDYILSHAWHDIDYPMAPEETGLAHIELGFPGKAGSRQFFMYTELAYDDTAKAVYIVSVGREAYLAIEQEAAMQKGLETAAADNQKLQDALTTANKQLAALQQQLAAGPAIVPPALDAAISQMMLVWQQVKAVPKPSVTAPLPALPN